MLGIGRQEIWKNVTILLIFIHSLMWHVFIEHWSGHRRYNCEPMKFSPNGVHIPVGDTENKQVQMQI